MWFFNNNTIFYGKIGLTVVVTVLSCSIDGHSEAEFGMSWCAGFGGSFYNSYFEVILFAEIWYRGFLIILHHIFSLNFSFCAVEVHIAYSFWRKHWSELIDAICFLFPLNSYNFNWVWLVQLKIWSCCKLKLTKLCDFFNLYLCV